MKVIRPLLVVLLMLSVQFSAGAKMRILSDRSIYIAGEVIYFSVFEFGEARGLSTVFYMELVSPAGHSYARAKIRMDSTGAIGALEIPRELSSGTYYLKGYTRWMRNLGPSGYTFLAVEVVNPFKKSVLAVDTLTETEIKLSRGQSEPAMDFPIKGGVEVEEGRKGLPRIKLPSLSSEEYVECCVSVVRKGSLEEQSSSLESTPTLPGGQMHFIPETRGVSLKGKVELAGAEVPVPYAVVYLSIMGDEKDFYCTYADSAGQFYFALPDTEGASDLFISASHPDFGDLELFIDQDFCTDSFNLPSPALLMGEEREKLLSILSVNAQISLQYSRFEEEAENSNAPPDELYFYGRPGSVANFDDFIRLPTMEEYFTEVCSQVSIRKVNRKKLFQVQGEHPDLRFFDPLVMVDGVAVFDTEAVLAINPGYIKGVEVVQAPYVRGNVTFGGIINIISRKGDMGYIDLPASGLLINYTLFTELPGGSRPYEPGYMRIPDVRNTLYWNPRVQIAPGEKKSLSFSGTRVPGEYQVVIRGYNASGRYFENRLPYLVSQ